ncbi:hypothetical protein [Christiangramia salexigens]|uniref:Uncharacterized protein n=1 Tax=Christiangramia salexigens TaxID=1913577 RepID=A0A1L3J3P1_9FLAO|nr:hypothetical protein [Christiangramia salexigens]APG59736.1 hypothetical protein LPB144_04595 [Christiangramia salexigens]
MKPKKSTYSDSSGFKVPQNYFENLENQLMHRINTEEKAELTSRNSGFNIPEGYFDSLEDRIMSEAGRDKSRVISLFRREYFYYAAAVAAVLIIMTGNFFQVDGSSNPLNWESVEISAIENYIDEGYEMGYIDLNANDYSQYIFEDGKLVDDADFNSIDSEAALEYMNENIEDPALILE